MLAGPQLYTTPPKHQSGSYFVYRWQHMLVCGSPLWSLGEGCSRGCRHPSVVSPAALCSAALCGSMCCPLQGSAWVCPLQRSHQWEGLMRPHCFGENRYFNNSLNSCMLTRFSPLLRRLDETLTNKVIMDQCKQRKSGKFEKNVEWKIEKSRWNVQRK